jgi:hypothetical protein
LYLYRVCSTTQQKYSSCIDFFYEKNGRWYSITGLRETKAYRLAERIGQLSKLGTVSLGLPEKVAVFKVRQKYNFDFNGKRWCNS